MATKVCTREAETIGAAWSGSDKILDPDLAAHVAQCEECAEILALARALREDRQEALAYARPPSAGAVWWRAQRRAREEAARRATRPISLVHGIALGCGLAAVVAILSLGVGGFLANPPGWLTLEWPTLPAGSALDVVRTLPVGALLMLAASLLLAPVAVYLAITDR